MVRGTQANLVTVFPLWALSESRVGGAQSGASVEVVWSLVGAKLGDLSRQKGADGTDGFPQQTG